MRERIRIGMIGCGRIADLQCLGYLEHSRAEIAAVCDVDEALAQRRAREWGADSAYTSLDALLADPTIDAVDILTPHHLHAAQAIAALEAGKHVSLQKPPVLSLEEWDTVTAASRRAGRTLRVFENFMYYPPHVKAKELISQGAIGEPISVRVKTAAGHPSAGWTVQPSSQAWRMDPSRCGGGPTTFDHGYHCYNMGRFFIPAEIERVHAFIHWFQVAEGAWYDGPALISWKYAGEMPRYGSWEVIGSLGMKVRSKYYVSDDRVEIHGTHGIIWVNRCTGQLLDEPSVVLYADGETRAFHGLDADWADSFRMGTRDFVDALLEERQPAQDADEARQTLAFALAAGRSAAEHREVTLAEVLGS